MCRVVQVGVGHRLQGIAAGVKSLLPSKRELLTTRTVDALMEQKPSPETDSFLHFDPKSTSSRYCCLPSPSQPSYCPLRSQLSHSLANWWSHLVWYWGRSGEQASQRPKIPFKEALVFVIGGGNYLEYQNVEDWANVCCPPPYLVARVCYAGPTMHLLIRVNLMIRRRLCGVRLRGK